MDLAPPRSLALLTFSAKKREGELTVAQGRVKDLESLFHRSEVELAAALSDKRGLESDVAELRAQLAKVGAKVRGTPQQGVCSRHVVTPARCPVSPRPRTVMQWPKSSWRRRH